MMPMDVVYRHMSYDVFQEIDSTCIIRKTPSNVGNPRSSASCNLSGVFFMANVDTSTGRPPVKTSNGEYRVNICVRELLRDCNMYFADFYRMGRDVHYVTLVAAKLGSLSDEECQESLIPFSAFQSNRFLHIDKYETLVSSNTWIEILYTENVDLTTLETWWLAKPGTC